MSANFKQQKVATVWYVCEELGPPILSSPHHWVGRMRSLWCIFTDVFFIVKIFRMSSNFSRKMNAFEDEKLRHLNHNVSCRSRSICSDNGLLLSWWKSGLNIWTLTVYHGLKSLESKDVTLLLRMWCPICQRMHSVHPAQKKRCRDCQAANNIHIHYQTTTAADFRNTATLLVNFKI